MTQFPTFKAGDSVTSWSARELNNMVAAVRRMDNLTVGSGLRLSKTNAGGSRIDLVTSSIPSRAQRFRALIVSPVQENDRTLRVRRVRYSGVPPIGTIYLWQDDAFEAYPAIGFTVEDFAGMEWTEEEPTIDAPFIEVAKRDDRMWLAEPVAVSSIMSVVIRTQEPEGMGTILVVSPVQDGSDGEPIIMPTTIDMLTEYNLKVRDYWAMAQPFGDTVTPATNFVLAIKRGRFWRVQQMFRDDLFPEDANFRITDCRPHTEPQP